ncbi:MAG: CDP-alcohol phosphatidyltransferase family protein, partial [Candidatus Marinimicrobia bacterium]|nr:CDP-alcohol phosphatidyltransferase family protein [Candidatus Neomarinimicrobiota bacterium]
MYCLFADFSHGKLLALIVFILASVTDAYDGILARKYNNVSKIGTFLDPLADKFLVLSAFYGFMFLPILSTTVKLWMIILISFRDILVTVLRTLMEYKGVTMITSKLGKFKTSLQILTITFILIFLILNSYQVELPDVNAVSSTLYLLMVFTTAITFYTGLHYFYH